MSCNGCRVLRKGCSENCILRPCLQWIDSPESQGHATVFVAKFFGRAGLMSFISNVPESQRPALFHSLLFEACGRTVNPVNGAVGLLGTGNWQVCQAAVETVLRGGTLRPMQAVDESFEEATCSKMWSSGSMMRPGNNPTSFRKNNKPSDVMRVYPPPPRTAELDLSLSPSYEQKSEKRCRRAGTPSEESGTSFERGYNCNCELEQQHQRSDVNLLELFR
ncbi:unnamed protein product [Rhodiola kirilowii]